MKIRQLIQITCLSLAAVTFIPAAYCEHPELAGTWELDGAASSFGAAPAPQSGLLTISTGRHRMMHMQLILKGPESERTLDRDWKIDNRFHPMTGDESGEVLAKWDGSILVGKRSTDTGMEEIRLIASPGGDMLTESIQSSQGSTRMIFRRR
jgi:hypothetical protein